MDSITEKFKSQLEKSIGAAYSDSLLKCLNLSNYAFTMYLLCNSPFGFNTNEEQTIAFIEDHINGLSEGLKVTLLEGMVKELNADDEDKVLVEEALNKTIDENLSKIKEGIFKTFKDIKKEIIGFHHKNNTDK